MEWRGKWIFFLCDLTLSCFFSVSACAFSTILFCLLIVCAGCMFHIHIIVISLLFVCTSFWIVLLCSVCWISFPLKFSNMLPYFFFSFIILFNKQRFVYGALIWYACISTVLIILTHASFHCNYKSLCLLWSNSF